MIHDNLLDPICIAFMVHLLPSKLRSKVMEKKPMTMAESTKYAAEMQRLLRDKNRPLGATAKPLVLAI